MMVATKNEKNKLNLISSVMKNSYFKDDNISQFQESSDEEHSNKKEDKEVIKRRIQVDELTIKFTARRMMH